MSELRQYNRRPCCLIRYRHGGHAAISPHVQKIVMNVATAKTGTSDIVIAADAPEIGKVLVFPGQSERPDRNKKARLKGRPNSRNKA